MLSYEITYTTDSKFKKGLKKVKIKNPKTVKKAIKKLKKNKKYYVKVRAYTDYNGVRYYGDRSTMLSSYYSNVYATYYSYYVNNKNRTTNLKIASKKINGTIIQPGETFDFNKVVGSRTAAKGYKKAHVFTGENSTTMGLAGGICQVAQLYLTLLLFQMLKLLNAINTAKGYLMFRLVEMLLFQAMFKISDGKIIQSMQLKLR